MTHNLYNVALFTIFTIMEERVSIFFLIVIMKKGSYLLKEKQEQM
ncbi:hypothetical protein SAMN04488696_0772 [Methanolobus profundi]|uniref:Uncharacterized protein n=1 Tax=Methanolobus profundi TaxID=487685 RepID=A0A1I4PMZ3_9EURY|nr:hypothetical protein SAMN04488696_0772 [Methanolobus profundi]